MDPQMLGLYRLRRRLSNTVGDLTKWNVSNDTDLLRLSLM